VAEENETPTPDEQQATPEEQQAAAEEAAAQEVPAGSGDDAPTPPEPAAEQPVASEDATGDDAPAAEADAPAAEEAPAEGDAPAADAPAAEGDAPAADAPAADEGDDDAAPREKPAIPGADLELDIVLEGEDPLMQANEDELSDAADEQLAAADQSDDSPIAAATIDLAADARYRATGKRKTAIARVILKPGSGSYTINEKPLDAYFPRPTLQRNIRQPLETVGYEDRMDVVARLHGGGVSAQAGALRHGISRALLEADPNLRGELKRRGFLTRDARAKERKKAGLKKARKRPQFSKR
jgi:small subunit ribosomal protein S9